MMRAVWSQDPVTFRGKYIAAEIADMSMLPQPVAPIPIWLGSRSEAAHKPHRQVGDGWHGSQLTPEEAAPVVARLRRDRPGPDFTISIRSHWDGKDRRRIARPHRRLRRSRRAAHHGPPA